MQSRRSGPGSSPWRRDSRRSRSGWRCRPSEVRLCLRLSWPSCSAGLWRSRTGCATGRPRGRRPSNTGSRFPLRNGYARSRFWSRSWRRRTGRRRTLAARHRQGASLWKLRVVRIWAWRGLAGLRRYRGRAPGRGRGRASCSGLLRNRLSLCAASRRWRTAWSGRPVCRPSERSGFRSRINRRAWGDRRFPFLNQGCLPHHRGR
jgi:hypothetical protein